MQLLHGAVRPLDQHDLALQVDIQAFMLERIFHLVPGRVLVEQALEGIAVQRQRQHAFQRVQLAHLVLAADGKRHADHGLAALAQLLHADAGPQHCLDAAHGHADADGA